MLDEIGSVDNVRNWLDDAIAHKKKIMGFGHRVYKVKDPLRHGVARDGRKRLRRDRPAEVVRDGDRSWSGWRRWRPRDRRASIPTSISTPACVYQSIGIPRDLFTPIFAIARVAGWLSHWLEQLKNNRIFRPEQIYVGKHDVHYVPLEKRP